MSTTLPTNLSSFIGRLGAAAVAALLALLAMAAGASAHDDPSGEHLDPARNVPLP